MNYPCYYHETIICCQHNMGYTAICLNIIRVCSLAISNNSYFLRISKVWNMLYHGLVARVQIKECYFMFTYTFSTFLCCFLTKSSCFYHFHFFFWLQRDFNHNHLVRERTLNYLAKLRFQISRLFRARGSWHSSNYRASIHSETRTWHNKNIQSGY